MRTILKFTLNILSISAGPAVFLLFWTLGGLTCLGWGIWAAPDTQFPAAFAPFSDTLASIPDTFAFFRNPFCALGTLLLCLTYLLGLGFMYDAERRRFFFSVSLSLLLHAGLFLLLKEAIVGQELKRETEVALNLQELHHKAPVIVNDFYYGDLEGDEVFQDPSQEEVNEEENEEDNENEKEEEENTKPQPQDTAPEIPPVMESLGEYSEVKKQLQRVEDSHKELESQQEASTPQNGEDARSQAGDIKPSPIEAPDHKYSEKYTNNPADENKKKAPFAMPQLHVAEAQISGLIGSESPQLGDLTEQTELHSAESVERRTVNLQEEARKRNKQKGKFRQALNENQKKKPRGKISRKGEDVVAGQPRNWGETPKGSRAGSASNELGELRSGLGEERAPSAGMASVDVSKNPTKNKPGKTLKTAPAKPKRSGGQTLGARAGEDENLDAVLAGAISGVSDAVLETTAMTEEVMGSNVLEAEKKEVLKNVVVFQFEESDIPEMGFQPSTTELSENEEDTWLTEEEDPLASPETPVEELLPEISGPKLQACLPFRQRMRKDHQEMIEKAGGNPETEAIIEHGLEYLSRTQFEDGHWSLNFVPNGLPDGMDRETYGFGTIHADTAATGLALLTYLGAGHTHLASDEKKPYTETVNRALTWLLRNQQPDGSLFSVKSDAHRYGRIYSHGMATIALCEAYGMTRDERLREPAQRAIDFIVKAQGPQGGWRYTPAKNDGVWRGESDTSVTGWQMMALVSAKMAGLRVPDHCFQKVENWLETAAINGGERYCYLPVKNPQNEEMEKWKKPSYAMTAEGLLMELYLDHDSKTPEFHSAASYLMKNTPTMMRARRDTYYWYYATQVFFHLQDESWQEWQSHMFTALKNSQELEDPFLKGSWSPYGKASDHWGQVAGRHYVTTMHILMLEVYYRYLPLFKELNGIKTQSQP